MGNPVVQHDGDHLNPVARDGGPSLVHEGALHRGGVENHRRDGSGLTCNFDTGSDRVQVGDRCATWDEHEVGGAGGGQRRIRGVRRGVDDGKVGPGITCGRQQGGELVRMARDDCGGISDAETCPRRGRTLWVEVHQRGGEPSSFAGDGKAARERCLPCAALPADECDREHWIVSISYYTGYIHILDITLNRLSAIRQYFSCRQGALEV